jgi:hypothetical protein
MNEKAVGLRQDDDAGRGAEPAAGAGSSGFPGAGEPAWTNPEGLERRVAELRRLDAEDPDGRWFLVLGSALRDLGHPLEALQVVRRGLARDPDCLGGWVVLGQCYLALNELAASRRVFSAVVGRDRNNALALRGLAVIHAREGDRSQATAYYRHLLKLVPRDLGAQKALAELLTPEEDEVGPAVPGQQAAETASDAVTEPAAESESASTAEPGARQPEKEAGRMARSLAGAARSPFGRSRSGEPPVPRSGRAVLKPESRPSPGIFEPLPADLDSGKSVARLERRDPAGELEVSGQGAERSSAAHRRRRTTGRRPARSAAAGGRGAAARARQSAPVLSRRKAAAGQAGGRPEGVAGAGTASFAGYKRWLERMMDDAEPGPGAGPRAGGEE